MPSIDIQALRDAVRDCRYTITTHAMRRMNSRGVAQAEMLAVIDVGEVIEQHPDNQPHPKALFMALVNEQPLYVSCAFDGRYAYIITVHHQDPALWSDSRTRRKN